ncbi:hypothetical protein [Nocardia amamiensis]|uniref:hypothetical protein n=1 Tax=Nocardia amamiensis TaxID=404578 RepID=UPI001C3FDDE0|nr:hypothetical protein [Nocardia amamiensis]
MDQHSLSEPGYQLVWPRGLFAEESARLLNVRAEQSYQDWNTSCELLLEHAFVRGFIDGPLAEFQKLPQVQEAPRFQDLPAIKAGKAVPARSLSPQQKFLRELLNHGTQLHEDPPPRRPYYGERNTPAGEASALTINDVAREIADLTRDLDQTGYFDKRFGVNCDSARREPGPEWMIVRELKLTEPPAWPLDPDELTADPELFFRLIEMLHDNIARPRRVENSHYEFGEACTHYTDFHIGTGKAIYRWRVNKILDRSDLDLRLAEEGEDVGRLVTATDLGRTDLLDELASRGGREPAADEVLQAVAMFRARGAGRQQKQAALAMLSRVLEERRYNVLAEVMTKKDSGALFEIANGFHIRHGDARIKQQRDYEDYYLDWIFWLYLSSIELTNRVLDDQALTTKRDAGRALSDN